MASGGDLPQDSFLRQPRNDHELHRFIDEKLQPTEVFNRECNEKTNALAEFLKTEFLKTGTEFRVSEVFLTPVTKFSVSEVFKGGSLKKGTAIKGQADLDAIVFINGFRPLRNLKEYKGEVERILKELGKKVSDSGRIRAKIEHRTQYALKITVTGHGDSLDVDILPAPAENNAQTRDELQKIFEQMDGQTEEARAFYSSSLSPWQVKFVHGRIGDLPNVKNLVRLVKHWRKTHLPDELDFQDHYCFLPTSYVFELLAISRWEQTGGRREFSVKQAFKDIMMQLANPGDINAQWSDYYNRAHFRNACTKKTGTPFILDPANPFNNVCARFDSHAWNEVARMARLSLASRLLQP